MKTIEKEAKESALKRIIKGLIKAQQPKEEKEKKGK